MTNPNEEEAPFLEITMTEYSGSVLYPRHEKVSVLCRSITDTKGSIPSAVKQKVYEIVIKLYTFVSGVEGLGLKSWTGQTEHCVVRRRNDAKMGPANSLHTSA